MSAPYKLLLFSSLIATLEEKAGLMWAFNQGGEKIIRSFFSRRQLLISDSRFEAEDRSEYCSVYTILTTSFALV